MCPTVPLIRSNELESDELCATAKLFLRGHHLIHVGVRCCCERFEAGSWVSS